MNVVVLNKNKVIQLTPYGTVETCPKCLGELFDGERKYCVAFCVVDNSAMRVVPHIHRDCPRCGFLWIEACADTDKAYLVPIQEEK